MGAGEEGRLSFLWTSLCPHVSIRPSILLGVLFSHPGQVSWAALTTPGPRVQVEEAGGRQALPLYTCKYQPLTSPGFVGWGGSSGGGRAPATSPKQPRVKPQGPQKEGNRPEITQRGAGGSSISVLLTGAVTPQQWEQEAAVGCAPTLLPWSLLPARTLSRSFWAGASWGHCGHATRCSQEALGHPGTWEATLPLLEVPLEDLPSRVGVRGGA